MATEGRIPFLGFKAAAIKFVTLLGFSPNPSSSVPSAIVIQLYGSPVETVSLAGSPALETLSGSPVETVTLGGSL